MSQRAGRRPTGYGGANGAAASGELVLREFVHALFEPYNARRREGQPDRSAVGGDDPRLAVIDPGEGNLAVAVDEGR
jgi:hypothetical protein